MTLWTIQSMAAWEVLERDGVLVADERYAETAFLDAYRWMFRQMVRRMGRAPGRRFPPLWAWYQWRGAERRKPDLRASGHLPKGQRGVRIEFEQSSNGVLLSDYSLWHFVLNYAYLPRNEADGDAFRAELSRLHHQRVKKSWNRIFDLAWADEYFVEPYAEKMIQATLWELRLDHVRDVKVFTAR